MTACKGLCECGVLVDPMTNCPPCPDGSRLCAHRARTELSRPDAVARTTKGTKLQDLFLDYDVAARGQ